MTKTMLWVLALVVALGGLWWFTTHSAVQTSGPMTKSFTLVVANRKLVSGPSTLSVTEGDLVTINITVDEDEELHLHGYDKSIDLTKGVQGSLTFEANASGRFPFELEHSKTELGAVEVAPR